MKIDGSVALVTGANHPLMADALLVIRVRVGPAAA
jgi:hypothetical protein